MSKAMTVELKPLIILFVIANAQYISWIMSSSDELCKFSSFRKSKKNTGIIIALKQFIFKHLAIYICEIQIVFRKQIRGSISARDVGPIRLTSGKNPPEEM